MNHNFLGREAFIMNYHYPIEEHWSKQEVIDVVNFFNMVESAYEGGVNKDDVLLAYTRFKQIVPSKSEEKTYFREFERGSSYVPYRVVKMARQSENKRIKLNKPSRR